MSTECVDFEGILLTAVEVLEDDGTLHPYVQASTPHRDAWESIVKDIPELPIDDGDAWRAATVYSNYLRLTRNLGEEGWRDLDDVQRATATSLFQHFHDSCGTVSQAWTQLLVGILKDIVQLHENLCSARVKQPDPFSLPMKSAQSTLSKTFTRTKFAKNAKSGQDNSTTDVMPPLTTPPVAPTRRKRKYQPSTFGQTSMESLVNKTKLPASRPRTLGPPATPDVEDEMKNVTQEAQYLEEPEDTSGLSPDGSLGAGQGYEQQHDSEPVDNRTVESSLALDSVLSILYRKLGESRQSDPTMYFGNTKPRVNGPPPSGRAAVIFSRTLDPKYFPRRLNDVITAIKSLQLTESERNMFLARLLQSSPSKISITKLPDPIGAVLQSMEIRRGVLSSSWLYDAIMSDYEVVMNAWGVAADHQETCVLVHEKLKQWAPEDLVKEFKRVAGMFSDHFLPVALFKKSESNQLSRHRLSLLVKTPGHPSPRSSISIALSRYFAWYAWSKGNLTPAEKEAELNFVPGVSLHGSHRCGHGHSIISGHIQLEPKWLNNQRDDCQGEARRLRFAGKPVPEFCTRHPDNPCYMRLQARTTAESFNIQASIALGESKHWVEELEHVPYPKHTDACAFRLVSGSEMVEEDELTPDDPLHVSLDKIKAYDGPLPPRIVKRIPCPLCLVSFHIHCLDFFYHCRDEHGDDDEGMLKAIIEHQRSWGQSRDESVKKKPGYEHLEQLLRVNPPMTKAEALRIVGYTSHNCPFCSEKGYHYYRPAAFLHLNKHFDEPLYLKTVIDRGNLWDGQNIAAYQPYGRERIVRNFLADLLAPGVTSAIARDLIIKLDKDM